MSTDPAVAEVARALMLTSEYQVGAAFTVPPLEQQKHAEALARAACAVLIPPYTQSIAQLGEYAVVVKRDLERAEIERDSAQAQVRRLERQLAELAGVAQRVKHVMVTSATDWGAGEAEAQLWGAFVGWECDEVDPDDDVICQDPESPDHACDDALRAVAARFGWSDAQVAALRRHRGVVRRLLS